MFGCIFAYNRCVAPLPIHLPTKCSTYFLFTVSTAKLTFQEASDINHKDKNAPQHFSPTHKIQIQTFPFFHRVNNWPIFSITVTLPQPRSTSLSALRTSSTSRQTVGSSTPSPNSQEFRGRGFPQQKMWSYCIGMVFPFSTFDHKLAKGKGCPSWMCYLDFFQQNK